MFFACKSNIFNLYLQYYFLIKLIINFEHFFNIKFNLLKSYSTIDKFKANFKTVVTIGTFDGVHIGHRFIVNHLNKTAKRVGGESVLLTFSPHPRFVLYGDDSQLKLLDTLYEKKEKLKEIGLQNFVVQNFSKEFSRMKYVDFVRNILVKKLNVDHLVIGYDHHFGRNREGSINELKDLSVLYNFTLEQIPPQKEGKVSVSSTKIRKLIQDGNIKEANKFLGHQYLIIGQVVHGNKLGRTINYPTANIEVEKQKLIPKAGVYAVQLELSSLTYYGMLNIGIQTNKIEVHIFNFAEEIYGKELKIQFVCRVRDGMDFENISLLRKQLEKDEKKCTSLLGI